MITGSKLLRPFDVAPGRRRGAASFKGQAPSSFAVTLAPESRRPAPSDGMLTERFAQQTATSEKILGFAMAWAGAHQPYAPVSKTEA